MNDDILSTKKNKFADSYIDRDGLCHIIFLNNGRKIDLVLIRCLSLNLTICSLQYFDFEER